MTQALVPAGTTSTALQAPMTIDMRPQFGRLFGITHNAITEAPVIRVRHDLKVGIGVPKGRAYMIFKHGGKWHIRYGVWDKSSGKDKLVMKTVFTSASRAEAEAYHAANKDKAAISNRPQKIPYFTFTRRTVVEDAGGKPAEIFEPDWDAIEAHGEIPKKIPIILTSEQPFKAEYAWWTASELKCHGDGKMAERAVSFGTREDPGWEEAKRDGLKFFPYSPCYATGCEYAGKECKPHGTLNLQLAYAMRIGSTSYFSTTSEVSCSQLFSAIEEIRIAVERKGYSMVGIPMDLVLSSFRANHDGKPSIQPCVSLELRAAAGAELNKMLKENSWIPLQIGRATPQIAEGIAGIEGSTYEVSPADDDDESASVPAVLLMGDDTDGMGPDEEADFDDAGEVPALVVPAPVATVTKAKMDGVAEQLRARRAAEAAAQQPAPAAPAETPLVFPWTDLSGMNILLKKQYNRVKMTAVDELLLKHGKTYPTLKPDDPATLAFYNDLVTSKDLF